MLLKMENRRVTYIKSIDFLIIGFIFLVLFTLPVLFTRVNGDISWNNVFKIWKDQFLLIPLFVINRWILVPKYLLRKKYLIYLTFVLGLVAVLSTFYYYYDEVLHKKPVRKFNTENNRPDPIPPYANLLMYSFLIVGVDSGLLFSKMWHQNEEKKQLLENENTKMQLDILRNQISPHFFMNTLNNIYALVDIDSRIAKDSVMKLSKLMRYILYENENGSVSISKEFEFIKSYIDLMKLRSVENSTVQLILPEEYQDVRIPSMIFISYIENAFKYGMSYQNKSFINIVFEIRENRLLFNCFNTINSDYKKEHKGGLGMKNNENRLKMLFNRDYDLNVNITDKICAVSLTIPLL